MNSETRIALNTLVEDIDYLDEVLEDEEYLRKSITLPLKCELSNLVESIVNQEAEYKKKAILEEGYVDDVTRIRKLLGIASDTELKA